MPGLDLLGIRPQVLPGGLIFQRRRLRFKNRSCVYYLIQKQYVVFVLLYVFSTTFILII